MQGKQCVNFRESHSALTRKRRKLKEILKVKRAKENAKQKMSYANITQITSAVQRPNYDFNYKMPIITKEEIFKINICVAYEHNKNQVNPGCYKYELNWVLKANNLPNINIPKDTDSTA